MPVLDARDNVTRQLAAAYDRFANEEQELIGQARYAEAQGAHEYAMWILRAYKAELNDPVPEGLSK